MSSVTGGRRGLSGAEKYPTDFSGILAGAPALNWDQFMVAQMWPQLVMEWNNDELSACGERLVNAPLDARCPDYDGQFDGVLDPAHLRRDRRSQEPDRHLHGHAKCSPPTDALVVQEIWHGPRFSGRQSNVLTGSGLGRAGARSRHGRCLSPVPRSRGGLGH
ncbi:MAG: tannase/feruloyl esterase family alpha/beta hydrolase, partial [Solirubrobacterales bacterium]|nr:tannase/feruloyl esterase family alpha/beta hydrolase [Solirubrobacterales bacterium]